MRREAVVEMPPPMFRRLNLKEELEMIKELKNGDTS
jgi:hypothetical protein